MRAIDRSVSERVPPREERAAPAALRPAGTPAAVPIWVIAAHVDRCPVDERAQFVARVRRLDGAGALLVTCHRAELYGTGNARAAEQVLERLDAAPADRGNDMPRLRDRLRVLTGEAAARHAFRLAAGLESAVVGEDQVLHQVRQLREGLRARRVDPHLPRLFEMAIGVGRRSRAARAQWQPSGESLAGRALDWLALRGGVRPRADLLVVGAGTMGMLLAHDARRRGLGVTVSSRSRDRARALASAVGGRAVDLTEAASLAGGVAGVAIALGGPWRALASDAILPPTVDLSSPPAIPHLVASRGGGPFLDIDGLHSWDGAPRLTAAADAYAAIATTVVEDAVDRFATWSSGRASLATLRAIRERAERERVAELERLMRRLPALPARDRALVEAFSEQLVASLLHAPTAELRDDTDGSAAEAARRLFEL